MCQPLSRGVRFGQENAKPEKMNSHAAITSDVIGVSGVGTHRNSHASAATMSATGYALISSIVMRPR